MHCEVFSHPSVEASLVVIGKLYSLLLSSSATGMMKPSKPEILNEPPVVTKMF